MSNSSDASAPWDIPAARNLYNIHRWGAKYFDINEAGHVVAMPLQEAGVAVDITDVIEEAKGRGLKFPLLIRFQDILRHRVESINLPTREVTLKGSDGNVVSFTVDKRVTRLDEVKVGDTVIAEYYESFTAALRAPTAAEQATPVQVLTQTAKAPAGTQPAAGALHITRAVVTVEGLNRLTRTLTVSGKAGVITVEVDDVAALSKLKLGDTIVVTYTEALAVALEKRTPGK
jgi:hypothetical protein